MSNPNEPTPPPADSTARNLTVPAANTDVPAPRGNLSLKPVAPAAPPAAPINPLAASDVAPEPTPAPVAPKPKLNLNVAPRSTASDLNNKASAQKIPDRTYAPTVTEDDDQPSALITIIAGLAAAAAITFAVLLFLKTK